MGVSPRYKSQNTFDPAGVAPFSNLPPWVCTHGYSCPTASRPDVRGGPARCPRSRLVAENGFEFRHQTRHVLGDRLPDDFVIHAAVVANQSKFRKTAATKEHKDRKDSFCFCVLCALSRQTSRPAAVAQTGHQAPRQFGMFFAEWLRNLLGGFADDFQTANKHAFQVFTGQPPGSEPVNRKVNAAGRMNFVAGFSLFVPKQSVQQSPSPAGV